jgi:predicted glycosyltransferase involved in capsule biosynthesis
MTKLSLIVAVLDSHEVVRRQLLHLERLLTSDCELILVDDGSAPPLRHTWDSVRKTFASVLHETGDSRPWTQPRARNIGAKRARAEKLLFFDIDHVVTESVIAECIAYPGDMLRWVRHLGILNKDGHIVAEHGELVRYGMTDTSPSVHLNSFMIRRHLFDRLHGYDERFCGHYGGDDVDFHQRYQQLCAAGLAKPAHVRGEGFVFPDPARDVKQLFHSLPRS